VYAELHGEAETIVITTAFTDQHQIGVVQEEAAFQLDQRHRPDAHTESHWKCWRRFVPKVHWFVGLGGVDGSTRRLSYQQLLISS
jgi:hypothetical protein